MIGWWIVISTHSPEECDRADAKACRAAILAQWEAGAEGLRWIEKLVKQGKAAKVSGSGYPNRYISRAGDVLPLIEGGGIQSSQGASGFSASTRARNMPSRLAGWARLKYMPTAWRPVPPNTS